MRLMLVTLLFHTAVASIQPSLSLCVPHSVSPSKTQTAWQGLFTSCWNIIWRHLPRLCDGKTAEITRSWTWDPENWGREITLLFLCGRHFVLDFAVTTQRWFSCKQQLEPFKELMKNLWEALGFSLTASPFTLLHHGQSEFDFYLWACPV